MSREHKEKHNGRFYWHCPAPIRRVPANMADKQIGRCFLICDNLRGEKSNLGREISRTTKSKCIHVAENIYVFNQFIMLLLYFHIKLNSVKINKEEKVQNVSLSWKNYFIWNKNIKCIFKKLDAAWKVTQNSSNLVYVQNSYRKCNMRIKGKHTQNLIH